MAKRTVNQSKIQQKRMFELVFNSSSTVLTSKNSAQSWQDKKL